MRQLITHELMHLCSEVILHKMHEETMFI